MSGVVYSTETQACAVGIPGCSCDYNSPEWIAEMRSKGVDLDPVNSFCECHDCYTCGEIDCGGHR